MSDFRFVEDPALDKGEAKSEANAETKEATPAPPAPSAPPEGPTAPSIPAPAATPPASPAFSFSLPQETETPAPATQAVSKPTPQPVAPKPPSASAPPAVPPTPPATPAASVPSSASGVPPLPDLNQLKAVPPPAPNVAAPPTAPQVAPPPAPQAARPAPPPAAQRPGPTAPASPVSSPPATPRAPQPSAPPQPGRPPQGARQPQAGPPAAGQPAPAPTPRAPQPPVPPGAAPVAGAHAATPAQGRPAPQRPAPVPPAVPGQSVPAQGASAPRPPAPPTLPVGPQSAANQVAAHAAHNIAQAENRETGGLQKALWNLDGLVDRYSDYTKYILYIGAAGTVAALIFLAMQLFGGKEVAVTLGSKAISNTNTAGLMFGVMLILAAFGGIFAIWTQKGAGIAMTGIGLLVYFGAPFLVRSQFGILGPDNNSMATYAASQLISGCYIGGIGVAAIGLLKYLLEVMLWIVEMPDRMMQKANVGTGQQMEAAQQRVAKNANALSPCWSLPFCREVIRKQCPAYLARKTCWKFKRGCYCDDEMIARIIRGESLDKIKAPTKMSQLRKPPCGRCYIYTEHQTHKFRMISPITFPLAVVIVVALWNPFGQAFRPVYIKLDNMQKNLKFFQTPNPIEASAEDREAVQKLGEVDQEKTMAFTQWFIGLILGFLLLIYISKFMEWAVFEAKW